MRVEIDIDLDKIDYNSINEQIKKKIDETDLERMYRVNSYCEEYTQEEVKNRVNKYLTEGYSYLGLSDAVKSDIKASVETIVSETVKEKMDKIFSQISDEDFDKMIVDAIPNIIVDSIYGIIQSRITNSKYSMQSQISHEIDFKIKQALHK